MSTTSRSVFKNSVLCFEPISCLYCNSTYIPVCYFCSGFHMVYPPRGGAERTQWVPLDSLSILFVIENTSEYRRFSKPRKPLLSGWVDGLVVIKTVLRFFSFSRILTRKMRWFQIWPRNMSKAIRSKVKNNLILWSFRADFRGKKWQKIMVTNDLSSTRKTEESFEIKLCRKNSNLGSKISKKLKVQKWPQKSSTSS